MADLAHQFLSCLSELQLAKPNGYVDVLAIGTNIGLSESSSRNLARSLRREGYIEALSQQSDIYRLTTLGRAQVMERTMAIFDQRGQQVVNQFNAAGNVNVGSLQANPDTLAELEALRREIERLRETHNVDEEVIDDLTYDVTRAVHIAKREQPDNNQIVERIDNVKNVAENLAATGAATGNLIAMASKIIEQIGGLIG